MAKYNFPLSPSEVIQIIREYGMPLSVNLSIRQVNEIAGILSRVTQEEVVDLSLGDPGLKTPDVVVEAEIEALKNGAGARYPKFEGINPLREAGAEFFTAFSNIYVEPGQVFSTNGAIQGISLMIETLLSRDNEKKAVLINPDFSVTRAMLKSKGVEFRETSEKGLRGEELISSLDELLEPGDVKVLYVSNPRNPSGEVLTRDEIEGIGSLLNKYDIAAFEDLAYFLMDHNTDYLNPWSQPYPTLLFGNAPYVIAVISASKIFSYAGARQAICIVTKDLLGAKDKNEFFRDLFSLDLFHQTAGTNHPAQYGFAAGMKKATQKRDVSDLRYVRDEYGRRKQVARGLFEVAGFETLYLRKDEKGGGFYFCVQHPSINDGLKQIILGMCNGFVLTPLSIFGGIKEGSRVSVLQLDEKSQELLEDRLTQFKGSLDGGLYDDFLRTPITRYLS